MLSSLKPLWLAILRLIIYGLILVGIAQLLYLDAFNIVDGGKYTEYSYTEWAQSVILLLVVIMLFWTKKIAPNESAAIIGLIGFFSMAFIREFDMFLDEYVFDGAWQLIAFSILGITLIILIRRRTELGGAVQNIIRTSAFGIMSSGILITFIFSRLYGRQTFWIAVMEEKYFRNVKNVSEEGIELLGYTLILIGTIELFRILLEDHTKE